MNIFSSIVLFSKYGFWECLPNYMDQVTETSTILNSKSTWTSFNQGKL